MVIIAGITANEFGGNISGHKKNPWCVFSLSLPLPPQGMSYLEENDLVHCDLAARNVLGKPHKSYSLLLLSLQAKKRFRSLTHEALDVQPCRTLSQKNLKSWHHLLSCFSVLSCCVVQTPTEVKITDFGLARLLDVGQQHVAADDSQRVCANLMQCFLFVFPLLFWCNFCFHEVDTLTLFTRVVHYSIDNQVTSPVYLMRGETGDNVSSPALRQ